MFSNPQKQATKNDALVCISERFPESSNMLEHPVYFSQGVWELCQENSSTICNICHLAAYASTLLSKTNISTSKVSIFSVIVEGAERKPDFTRDDKPFYDLAAKIPAQKSKDSVIVIQFPDEIDNSDLLFDKA